MVKRDSRNRKYLGYLHTSGMEMFRVGPLVFLKIHSDVLSYKSKLKINRLNLKNSGRLNGRKKSKVRLNLIL